MKNTVKHALSYALPMFCMEYIDTAAVQELILCLSLFFMGLYSSKEL